MSDTFQLPRGGDLDFSFIWLGGDGQALNLALYNLVVLDAHAELLGHVTAAITNEAGGAVAGRIAHAQGMPLGRVMSFSLQLVPKSLVAPVPARRPLGPFWVDVQ